VCSQPDGVLTASRDQQVVGLRGEGALACQQLGQHHAQCRGSARVAVVEHAVRVLAQRAPVRARQ
jgi:hypothetical protein